MFDHTFRNFMTGLVGLTIPLAGFGAADIDGLPQGQFAMAGYGDVTYMDQKDGNSAFASRFVPIFLYQLNDKMHIESEINFSLAEDGTTETELEYADLHYYLTDSTVITAGKFLLPFGFFGPNLHPSWINKLPSMPAIYGEHSMSKLKPILPPLSDVGISVSQTFQLGNGSKIYLDGFVSNGPKTEEGTTDEVAFEANNADNNDNKAKGGRFAFAWLPSIEVGASYYQGAYDDLGEYAFSAKGVDFNYKGAYLSVNGEYLKTNTETAGGDVERNGWYLQGAWQLRQLHVEALNPLELVVRRGDITKTEGGDKWTYGVNYWLSPNSVVKVAYEDISLDDGTSDSVFRTQLAFGF